MLTPDEADEVLGHVRELTRAGVVSVLMITHKFREVTAYADEVTVLRRGRRVGGGAVENLSHEAMGRMMVGEGFRPEPSREPGPARPVESKPVKPGATILSLRGLRAPDRTGAGTIAIDRLDVRSGEIVGIAGVSGNGQAELLELLSGQRPPSGGTMTVAGEAYRGTRTQMSRNRVRILPEEPLANACAPRMSVSDNLAFRDFDASRGLGLDRRAMRERAAERVAAFGVRTTSLDAPVAALSGGNVQRTVLARELSGGVALLIVSNPCFGLDFSAVAEVLGRLRAARDRGVATLLMSEDLDEVLELSDRVLVMSEGRVVHEVAAAGADRDTIGRHMAGHAAALGDTEEAAA